MTIFKFERPKLTFIVVQKRGNTRFFYRSNGQYVNAPMGTVVDNTVTGRKINRSAKPLKRKSNSPVVIKQEEAIELNEITMSDFYLVSQSVRQGTVSPSHFRVIVNEHPKLQNSLSIQTITYKLTHM
jgi:aubergine